MKSKTRYLRSTLCVALVLTLFSCTVYFYASKALAEEGGFSTDTSPGVSRDDSSDKIILGYYEGYYTWHLNGDVDFSGLTHVAHAFMRVHPDGSLNDSWLIEPDILVQAAHQDGAKIVVSVGGEGSGAMISGVVADPGIRSTFISNLVAFVNTHGYDGVDLSWESPEGTEDRDNYVFLVRELRQQLGVEKTLSVTLGYSSWNGDSYAVEELEPDVDWFGALTYDWIDSYEWDGIAFPNSPLYSEGQWQSIDETTLPYWLNQRNIPAHKLLIGIPFYGYQFPDGTALYHNADYEQKFPLAYSEIAEQYLDRGWTRHWDASSHTPYLLADSGIGLITYDDEISVGEKVVYALDHNLGGVLVWAWGKDLLTSGAKPLLSTVIETFQGPGPGTPTPTATTTPIATDTPLPPTDTPTLTPIATPTPTDTPLPPTDTPTATNTPILGTEMHVESIDLAVVKAGGPNYLAQATVTILDNYGLPVEAATVTGTFSGDSSGTNSGPTDANGQVILQSSQVKKGSNWTLCVDDVSKGGYTYDSEANVETCDSTGTPPTDTPTPTPPPGGSTMHVGDLDGAGVAAPRNRWDATVTIIVHGVDEIPVVNAAVDGSWSVGASEGASCVTDSNGQCSVIRDNIKPNVASVTFAIDSISASGYTYDAGANHDPDGDSNGTSITILQP